MVAFFIVLYEENVFVISILNVMGIFLVWYIKRQLGGCHNAATQAKLPALICMQYEHDTIQLVR